MGTCITPGTVVAETANVNREPKLEALLRKTPERKMLGIKL